MKKGISLVSVAVIVVVLIILAGIVVTTGIDSFGATTLNTFALEILNIQTGVDEYNYRYEKYPTSGDISLDVLTMDANSLAQFNEESIVNNTISLRVVSLSAIGIKETEFGNNESIYDVYTLSETTGKVYYLEGVEYEGNKYYTLTNDLYNMANVSNVQNNNILSSKDIKIYDAIFSVSDTNYTNNPITVEVKLPKSATIKSVTTTKSVSAETIEGQYKIVRINETSTDKTGNYSIEVVYTYNGTQKTAKYDITTFDNTTPAISVTQTIVGEIKTISIKAEDEGSGVKQIKYIEAGVEDATYFEKYGKVITGSQMVLGVDQTYTIYVEDKAGNYTLFNAEE